MKNLIILLFSIIFISSCSEDSLQESSQNQDTAQLDDNVDDNVDDNGCVEEGNNICGWMEMDAINYDPLATLDDGSCQYYPKWGCLDPTACNFNGAWYYNNCSEDAVYGDWDYCEDNGTCLYDDDFGTDN